MKGKQESLEETLKSLNKKYGAGSIEAVGEDDERGLVEGIPTECYSLDRIFGCGGLPRGRIIDVYGNESSGKSTMSMYIIGQIQKRGGKAALIDAEFAYSSEYAKKVGVDIKELILSQPATGEEALDMVERLVNTGELDIIVVDSTAALVPAKELEGNISDHNVALQARLLSKGLRMIVGVASRSKTAIVFISQVRNKIGGAFMGPTTDTTGGKALKFFSSVRLKVEKIKTLKKGVDNAVYGNRLKITATKNKVGLPFKEAEFNLLFEKGVDVVGDVVDCAKKEGILKVTGMTYSFAGEKLGGSRESAIEFLESNKEIFDKIREQLMALGKDQDEKEVLLEKE